MKGLAYLFGLIYQRILPVLPENRFGDRLYAFMMFVVRHERLPTKKPLFNDVIYRIKTTDEILDPLRVFVSDKEYVKLYIRATVGEKYNSRTFGVIRNRADVRGFDFPRACCIKPTHSSGQVILRTDGEDIDLALIESWFSLNYYKVGREAQYKHLRPKVIVEEIVFSNPEPANINIFCNDGVPKMIQYVTMMSEPKTRKFLDCDWNELPYYTIYQKSERSLDPPATLAEMLDVSARLSAGFRGLVRIDIYTDGTSVIVGEITNTNHNANSVFVPRSAEIDASRLIFS
jgi:hypothetical protein